jgi:hypothetical protein
MTAQEIEAAKRLAQALIQFMSAAESALNAPKPPVKPPQSERTQSPAVPPSLLTSREAAKYLAVSPRHTVQLDHAARPHPGGPLRRSGAVFGEGP